MLSILNRLRAAVPPSPAAAPSRPHGSPSVRPRVCRWGAPVPRWLVPVWRGRRPGGWAPVVAQQGGVALLLLVVGALQVVRGQPFSDCVTSISNATIIIPHEVVIGLVPPGDTPSAHDNIAVSTDEGRCVGAGRWTGDALVIAAAGRPDSTSPGLRPGDPLRFSAWDASANTMYALSATYADCPAGQPLCQSDGRYAPDRIVRVSGLEVIEAIPDGAHAADPADEETDPVTLTGVTASAAQTGNTASNTIDGDLATRWSARGHGVWIQYTLSAPTRLDRIGIAWLHGDRRRARFAIALSTDGASWTTVYDGTSSGSTLKPEDYAFDAEPARYIRITGYGNTWNVWTAITEVTLPMSGGTHAVNKQLALDARASGAAEPLPETLLLEPNFPNPARDRTTIAYGVPTPGHVLLEVYDLLGRRVARPVDAPHAPGRYEALIDVSRWSSGVYIYRLRAGSDVRQRRLVVVQ